ncbi:hypothetical protein AHF37_06575 [Paragonimus kellicotti]|nr:hypothetical protein AHF37_06575 [Paragonimus kellicotti]
MEFPEEDDEGTLRCKSFSVEKDVDEDYLPGPLDFCILERNRALDVSIDGDAPSDFTQNRLEESGISTQCEEHSQQSSSTDGSTTSAALIAPSTSNNWLLEDNSTEGDSSVNNTTEMYADRLRSNHVHETSNMLIDPESDAVNNLEELPKSFHQSDLEGHTNIKVTNSAESSMVLPADPVEYVHDVDDDVYAEFLRSLFASNSSTHTTPTKKAALGSSLADQLEQLTVKKNLTARQVKKLLRAVLTNEDVISAFRRYINLSEPETGEISATTKRRARDLGLLSASSEDLQSTVSQSLEPRVITRFSPDQLLQLQRQLGMHVQLLTTQFLCTYDFSHLHLSVTRPCASALRELASRRDAFDLMASQQIVQASTGEPTGCENNNLRSFYWSCPSLSEAVRLISDYAGLSHLPRIPKHFNRSGGATVIDAGHQAGLTAQRRSFAANHLPLPLCLIRLMTGNPIWSYPYLMPCMLPTLYEPPEVPQRRRRLAFHPPEDALILLGLDDFSATFLPPAENTEPAVPTFHDDLQSHQSRYLTYRMVRKHLLPHRTLLQLRTRRWNLLSSYSANKLKTRSLAPLATSRLYELYVDVPHRAPLNRRLLRTFAEEVSKCSIPQHIPLRSGCLSDMPSEELFRRDGLPRQVGYETVLLNLSTERPCRGELSKLVHDMLTDFVQQAECLWWCWWSHEKVGVRPRLTASDRPVASGASYVSEQTVLKPEGTESAQRDLSMLGPTFLPAIPVDFTPDGPFTKTCVKLFSDEEGENQNDNRLDRPNASTVFAMKSHCHRLLSRFPKIEQPDEPENLENALDPSDDEPDECLAGSLPVGHLSRLHGPLPKQHDYSANKLKTRSLAPLATSRLYELYVDVPHRAPLNRRLLRTFAEEVSKCSIPQHIPLRSGCLSDMPSEELFRRDGLPRQVGYETVLLNLSTERPSCWTDFSTLSIPVDFTPDGNVILSKNAEPALVEINMATSVPSSMPPTTSVMATNCRPTETVISPKPPCITDHIEAVLAEIRRQAAFQSEHRYHSRRRLSCQLNPRTLKQLASPSPLSGKLPIPRLSSQRTALLPRRGSKTVKAKNNTSDLLPAAKALIPLVRSSSQMSNTVAPMSNPIDPTLMGMYCSLNRCQKYVDSLVNQFHCGFDKLVSDSGEALFGPFKFPNPVSNRRFPTGQSSHTEGSAPSDNQVAAHTDTVNTQQQHPISVFPNSCFLTANRFLTRCKARNEATTADLLTLPSSTLPHKRSVLDEFDVHRARSLLDRFRVYLTPADYGSIVLSLRQMNQVVYDTSATRLSVAQHQKDILLCLASILDQLRGHPFLWEDFLCLLTADQAKQLGLLSVYLDLVRVGRVQRVLQDLVPRGKRFWRRLRNLADSYDAEDRPVPPKRAILQQNEQSDQALFSSLKPVLSQTSSSTPCLRSQQVKRNHKLLRGKHVRTRFVRFPLPRTWAFLESTWRSRPILMSQIACLLNTHHKPYSGFEQAFEEIDLLARQPLGKFHLNTPFSEATADFVRELADGWEVCTALSASVRRLGLVANSQVTNKNCPCSCHFNAITTSLSGRPLKPDSLSLRHCMSCGLKVHRGIVYVEESNFHLRNVQIIWPEKFRLKTRLTPLVSHVVSQPNTGRMGTTPFSSTRAMLARLAELHARSNEDGSFMNVLPDLARRRVSLEFLPPSVKLESLQTPIVSVQEDLVLRQGKGEADDVVQATAKPASNPPIDREDNDVDGEDQSNESSETPVVGEFTRSPEHSTSPAHWLLDDEAACFNTEAFSSQDSSRRWQPTTGDNPSTWHSDEDRQLLEFCKARGRYSSTMFVDLARCWVPKPFAHSCCRTAIELETRFKRLMQRALGDAYDPELFCSPERESSDEGD